MTEGPAFQLPAPTAVGEELSMFEDGFPEDSVISVAYDAGTDVLDVRVAVPLPVRLEYIHVEITGPGREATAGDADTARG